MQCMNGDHQLLCGRVKRAGGVTFLIGDRNQARIAPVQNLTPDHITNLDKAFCGGPFHPRLEESLPACRAALVQAASQMMKERTMPPEVHRSGPPCADPKARL
eukprot:4708640-Heterocapsa_arctica.AAC.1